MSGSNKIEGAPKAGLKRRVGGALVLRGLGYAAAFTLSAVMASKLGAGLFGQFVYVISAITLQSALIPFGWLQGVQKFVTKYEVDKDTSRLWGVIRRSQQVTWVSVGLCSCLIAVGSVVFEPSAATLETLLGIALLGPIFAATRVQQQILLALQRVGPALLPVEVIIPSVTLTGVLSLKNVTYGTLMALHFAGHLAAWLWNLLSIRRALPSVEKPVYETSDWHAVTVPLISGALAVQVIQKGDVVILGPLVGLKAVGIYALAKKLRIIIGFGNLALIAALAPKAGAAVVARDHRLARQLALKGVKWALIWGIPPTIVLTAFSSWILSLFGVNYVEGSTVLQLMAIGALLNAATGPIGNILLFGGYTKFWRLSNLAPAVLIAASTYALAPSLGILGAALAYAVFGSAAGLARLIFLLKQLDEMKLADSQPD